MYFVFIAGSCWRLVVIPHGYTRFVLRVGLEERGSGRWELHSGFIKRFEPPRLVTCGYCTALTMDARDRLGGGGGEVKRAPDLFGGYHKHSCCCYVCRIAAEV